MFIKILDEDGGFSRKASYFESIDGKITVERDAVILRDKDEKVVFRVGGSDRGPEPEPIDVFLAYECNNTISKDKLLYGKNLIRRITYREVTGKTVCIYTNNTIYLCNDSGKTIDKYI